MTLATARQRWAKRRSQYAVGYIASGNLLFFARYSRTPTGNPAVDPMSLKQARVLLAKMPSPGAAIFKLVPMAIGGGRKR